MNEHNINGNRFFNQDCVTGSRTHIEDGSVDLIITDPPYGINGDTLHKHYYRDEGYVIDGYVEVPAEKYSEFSHSWINEAERILKPNGQIYIVSGYTNLYYVLEALRATKLKEINHIIWKYNFGVFTSAKYVSSHYHILYYAKPGKGKKTFNTESRYGLTEQKEDGGSLNYEDREDVWVINREYKPGQVKNKNELPTELLIKMIQYSSNQGDLVCDLFMGGFTTAKVAIGLGRKFVGFEISKSIFEQKITDIESIKPGYLYETLRVPEANTRHNQGKGWDAADVKALLKRYNALRNANCSKKDAIAMLSDEFGRGRWAIERQLKKNHAEIDESQQLKLID